MRWYSEGSTALVSNTYKSRPDRVVFTSYVQPMVPLRKFSDDTGRKEEDDDDGGPSSMCENMGKMSVSVTPSL